MTFAKSTGSSPPGVFGCGLYVIDLKTGDVADWLRLEGFVSELYDVVALPGVVRPSMIGFRSDEIRRTISIDNG